MSLSSFLKRRLEAFTDNLIFWAVVSGSIGGAVIAWIAARSAYLSGGFPLYKAIGLGLAFLLIVGFFLLLVALAYNLTASGAAKRRQALTLNPVNPKTQTEGTEWLQEIAAQDRGQVDAMVFVYGVRFEHMIVGSHSPAIQFEFDIFNGSVYPVAIDSTVTGFITYGERRLNGDITISDEFRPDSLLRGWTARLRIKLWLSRKDAEYLYRDLELNETPAPLFFSFDALVITVKGAKEHANVVASQRLRFRGCKAIDKNLVLR